MNPGVNPQTWLEHYAQAYLWADEDWLELGDQTLTYWQARLAQTTTIDVLPDGRAKWRVQTRIVNDVAEPDIATQVCFALNAYTAGWSFVYDGESRSIDAILAMCVPLEFDTWQLRLSEAAKLSAWMSDVIAERLADVVAGAPAFTHPANQPAVRETFDGTHYYLETLRGRPERVFDLTRRLYPPLPQVATAFAEMSGADADAVDVGDDGISLAVGAIGAELLASFAKHPFFGECWFTAVRFPIAMSDATAQLASTMAWHLYANEDSSLLGGWAAYDGDFVYAQWSTTSELRNQEQLPSNRGRSSAEVHGVGDLWGLSSAVNDAIHVTLDSNTSGVERGDRLLLEATRSAHKVLASISDVARPALSRIPTERGERVDRRLLWMERQHVLAVAVWFNPMGPSVSTLEVCSLGEKDDDYLLYFLRHPLAPDYRVLSTIRTGVDFTSAAQEGVKMLDGGSLPHVLMIFDAPLTISLRLHDLIRDQIVEMCRRTGADLSARTRELADASGDPWALAPHREVPDPTSAATPESQPSQADPASVYDQWLAQASDPANAAAIFAQLPDAWDGALNFQLSGGDLRWFDVGPLPIRYSSIGNVEK